MCARPPVSRVASTTTAMARSSASLGREPRNPAYPWPLGWGEESMVCGVLGMDDHQRVEGGRLGERLTQLGCRQVGELVDAGVQQEALEPEDPGIVQRPQVGHVARDGATPEADVDEGLVAGDRALLLQRRDRDGRRDAVERHVDDRRDTPGGGSAGGAGKALPVGAPRLVHVDVRVDEPGQQHLVVSELHDPDTVRHGRVVRLDRDDPVTGHEDAGRRLPATDHRSSGPQDHLCTHCHTSPLVGTLRAGRHPGHPVTAAGSAAGSTTRLRWRPSTPPSRSTTSPCRR